MQPDIIDTMPETALGKVMKERKEKQEKGFLGGLFGGGKKETQASTVQPTSGGLDPQVKALTKAIREVESGNRFDAKGASGEYGGYQFTPGTWEAYSKEFGINTPLEAATREQQTEVVYKKLKQWKDQGYNPGEIASMWNAGEAKKDAYLTGHSGTNKYGAKYDTQAYARKVNEAYQRLKVVEEAEAKLAGGQVAADAEQDEKGLGRKGLEFLFPILEEKERTTGQLIGDVGLSALTLVPGLGAAGLGAKALGVGGKAAIKGVLPKVIGKAGLATGLGGGYATDVASDLSQGGKTTAEILTPGLGTALGGAGAVGAQALRGTKIAKEALDEEALGEAMSIVAPTMTKKNVKEALKGGLVDRSGKLGTQITPGADPKTTRAAESIKDLVSRGTIKAKDTVEKKVNSVRDEIGSVAESLEQQLKTMEIQPLLTPEDLNGLIQRTKKTFDESPLLVGDAGKSAERIFNKFVEFLPKGRDVTAIDLLQARKRLDQWIKTSGRSRFFDPKTETAISEGLREIRQGANELIAQKAPNVAVKELLAKQSAMYDALDAIIENGWREVGTGAVKRFAKKHPYITGAIATGAAGLVPASLSGYVAGKVMGD